MCSTPPGYTVKFDGFTVLYEEKGDDGKTEGAAPLPPVKAGDKLRLKSILGNQHFTQPPARYTEASLTKALEENGVGRPSTYVTITSTIVGREYVKREGKQFVPTELGEAVTKLLEERMPNIVDVKYTSKMEADLDKIDSGDRDYIDMIRHYYEDFEAPLEKAKKEMQGVKIKLKEEETDVVCEKCGRNMVIKVGRYGKFLACPGYPECKNTKPLVFRTKAKCPVCGADVIEKKTRRGTSFYGCSAYPNCNFMTWDVPTDEVCPQCGKSLFKKRGNVLVCLDEKCGFSKPAPKKKKRTGRGINEIYSNRCRLSRYGGGVADCQCRPPGHPAGDEAGAVFTGPYIAIVCRAGVLQLLKGRPAGKCGGAAQGGDGSAWLSDSAHCSAVRCACRRCLGRGSGAVRLSGDGGGGGAPQYHRRASGGDGSTSRGRSDHRGGQRSADGGRSGVGY